MTNNLPPINEIRAELCRRSYARYNKYLDEEYYKYKHVLYDYQLRIIEVLNKVMTGEIKRLIINVPPRYRKTEYVVKRWVSYCLFLNPKAKFIHLSYSDDLALDNSEAIKDIILSDAYQDICPLQLKKDSKSKKKWYTSVGGGVYATSAGGQVTGFGAGKSIEEYETYAQEKNPYLTDEDLDEFLKDMIYNPELFGGAIIIDDPNKPEDASSVTALKKVNERFDSTIKNRVNSRLTPIIVIQQRVAPKDLSGYLLESGDDWYHLNLPAIDSDNNVLCDKFHTYDELMKIKEQNDKVFYAQYQQEPQQKDGLMYDIVKVDNIEMKGVNISVIDPADDGNCYVANVFAVVHSNKVWVYDVVYTQDQTEDKKEGGVVVKKGSVTQNIEKLRKNKPQNVYCEKNGMGNMYRKEIAKGYPIVQPFSAKGNKDDRIYDKAYFVNKYFRFLKTAPDKQYASAIRSMEAYQKTGINEFKDFQDAITSLAEIVLKSNLINILID